MSEADCRQVFRHYDTDRDGAISYDEWCAIHCQHFRDDSRTANMLDLPSIRLDVKHASMTEQESMAALRAELRRVLQTRSLESVLGGTEQLDATAAKQRLMDARVAGHRERAGAAAAAAERVLRRQRTGVAGRAEGVCWRAADSWRGAGPCACATSGLAADYDSVPKAIQNK